MSNTASNVEIVRKLLSGPPPDAAGMAAFAEQWLHADIVLSYPGASPIPFAGEWRSRHGVADFMTIFHEQIEIEQMQTVAFDGAGNDVFVRGMTRGRVRRTGKSYQSHWLLIWTVRDGKVARMTEYHDTQAIANAFV
jgi:ketosteroid isomerase-like protein